MYLIINGFITCRGDGIRTHDLLVPNQALYQAEPRPEVRNDIFIKKAHLIDYILIHSKMQALI